MDEKINRQLPRECFDPSAPPHWRWLAAERIVAGNEPERHYTGDADVVAAVAHLRACAAGEAYGLDAAIAEAQGLFRDDGLERAELEARLVAAQTNTAIARACRLPEQVVQRYQMLFFDVPAAAGEYLASQVVGAGRYRGFRDGEVRPFLIWAAKGTGPIMLDLLLDPFKRACRAGETPSLGMYLHPRSGVRHDVQAFVAASALPSSGLWLNWSGDVAVRLGEAMKITDAKERPLALAQLQLEVVQAGRAALAGAAPPPPKPKPKRSRQPSRVKQAAQKKSPPIGRLSVQEQIFHLIQE